MSEITITGATGVLGRRAVRDLVAAGHRVRAVTRSAAGRAVLEELGAEAVEADVFDPLALARAFAGSTAVVNLLTSIPPAERLGDPGAWTANDRLRREASAAVAGAATAAGARRLVQESHAYLYADGGEEPLGEDAPLDPAGPPASAAAAERNAHELFAGDVVVLRFATFVGPDSDLTLAQLEAARAGSSSLPARPGAYVPTVWLDDAAAAVAAAAVDLPAGTYNVVDDAPARAAELDAALAAAVGRDALVPPPGGGAPEVLGRSLRLSNARLRAAGWAPRVHAATEGWRLVEAAQVPA
jgi:nucleoside-diphosphate-sugar epimerase